MRGRGRRETVEDVAARTSAGSAGLPHLDRLQPLFAGHDLRRIRVSDTSSDAETRRRVRAHAFTQGDRVSMPRDASVELAAHEAAHVVQQRSGSTSDGPAAEAQANRVASRASVGLPVGAHLPAVRDGAAGRAPSGTPVLHRAPNQAGTTDADDVVQWVRDHSAGRTVGQVLDELSDAHGGNVGRYFYCDTYGWVDVRHFGAAASYAASTGSVVAEGLGLANEMFQWATEWGDDYRSGFSPEDIPSNAAGAEFGDDYAGEVEGESLAAALQRWMRDNGARPADDPRANREALPATDPSVRGGGGRGSSNASRTQSTVSGEASRQAGSAEHAAHQALDWKNWARLYGVPLP